MTLNLSKVVAKTLEQLIVILTINFDRIVARFDYIDLVVSDLVDTTTASVSKYLPDGNGNQVKQYQYVKVDASVNTVTIYPYTGQTILGTTSYVLAARYDRVKFTFCKATQDWILLSP